jgi:hypothetical protein
LPGDGALARAGLLVGPSIPLDIIQYMRTRNRDATIAVLEGIEMLLYPQFEGQDRAHQKIVEGRTEKQLAVWTGYEKTEE